MLFLKLGDVEINTYDELIAFITTKLTPDLIPVLSEKIKLGIIHKWIFQETQHAINPIEIDGLDDRGIIEEFAKRCLSLPNFRIRFQTFHVHEVVLYLLGPKCILHFRYSSEIAGSNSCYLSVEADDIELIADRLQFMEKEVIINKSYEVSIKSSQRIILCINGEKVSFSLYTTIIENIDCVKGYDFMEDLFYIGIKQLDGSLRGGYLDSKGCIAIPFKFEDGDDFHQGLALVRAGQGRYFINQSGEKIATPNYSSSYSEGMIGYDTVTGEYAFRNDYDTIEPFFEGMAVVKKNGRYGFTNKNGTLIVPLVYQAAIHFSEGLAAVKKNGKWGFIAPDGKLVISFCFDDPNSYDDPYHFKEGYAVVVKDGIHGYVNRNGNFIETLYSYIYDFSDGYAKVQNEENECIFLNKNFAEALRVKGFVSDFHHGKAFVESIDEKYFIIDKKGKELFSCDNDWVVWTVNAFKNKWVLRHKINTDSVRILDLTDEIHPKQYLPSIPINKGIGRFCIYLNDKNDYIVELAEDKNDKINTPLACVRTGDGYRFINQRGEFALSDTFSHATSFNDLFAIVDKGVDRDKNGNYTLNFTPYCINRKGEKLFDYPYSLPAPVQIEHNIMSDGLVAVTDGGKWGFINKCGHLIIPAIYEAVRPFSEGLAAVKKNGRWGYIDTGGNEIMTFIYDEAGPFSEGLATVYLPTYHKDYVVDHNFKVQFTGVGFAGRSFKEGILVYYDLSTERGGFLNHHGDIVFEESNFNCRDFHCGFAAATRNSKYGYVNKTGEWIVEPMYNIVGDFYENAALLQDSNGVYVATIEKKHIHIIPLNGISQERFPIISMFKNGLALINQPLEHLDRWGYVDDRGKLVIPNVYFDAEPFS